ncbi:MAG: hypothetical protein IT359_18600 [Gemmatimonadaceae bacterium]|nr:hypothetical protein [Gemmatimonadaceae bacterium]
MFTTRSLRIALPAALALALSPFARVALAQDDPRVGLKAGVQDAGEASRHMELVAHRPKAGGFSNAADPGDFAFANSDLAFSRRYAFQGGYHGVQVWDILDPRNPKIVTTYPCPGGQGDVSIYGTLLFMSVEQPSARIDCGDTPVTDTLSRERFVGVRIFDISNINAPRQLASVQTCRGSHTHTLYVPPDDKKNVYIYVQGTSPVRNPGELAGCSGLPPEKDPNTSYFRIEIIQVPLASPKDARVVNAPRIFADAQGNVAGLWKGGAHGEGTQETSTTDQCHDITIFPAFALAAGACSGNGILLDVKNPAAPRRIGEVSDPNFAYWHSATFSNNADRLLFTDEWGGGVGARCRATDRPTWGANATFTLSKDRKLRPAGYYKLPAVQTAEENCVAHNGSLVPVPGRDIMVQAWYQGGISVLDFTNPHNPKEIAFFDRGPLGDKLMLGGYWSAYWYNGYIYGSEIARGLDVLQLTPSELLTQNELDAARLVMLGDFNPQMQPRFTWPPSYAVSRAYLDQLKRDNGMSADKIAESSRVLSRAETARPAARRTALNALAATLEYESALANNGPKVQALAESVRKLAAMK